MGGRMAAEIKRKFKLGELLVTSGKLTQEQIDAALKRSRDSGTMLGETLVDMGLLKLPWSFSRIASAISWASPLRSSVRSPDRSVVQNATSFHPSGR